MPKTARLSLRDLSVQARLGCSERERSAAQEVRFSVDFLFAAWPAACESDRLEQTICYAQVADIIKSAAANPAGVHTIEHLASICLNRIKSSLSKGIQISLTVHKVNPPVEGLVGGTSFCLTDDA